MKAEKVAKAADPGEIFKFKLEKKLQCMGCNRVKYTT